MPDDELLEKFFSMAYPLLESENKLIVAMEIKQMLIDTQMLEQTKEKLLQNIIKSYFAKLYYLLIQNKVYQAVNKKLTKLLIVEFKLTVFLQKCFSKLIKEENAEHLYLFLQLLESLNHLDGLIGDYEEENGNYGRSFLSKRLDEQIENTLKEQEELQEQLKRTLEIN